MPLEPLDADVVIAQPFLVLAGRFACELQVVVETFVQRTDFVANLNENMGREIGWFVGHLVLYLNVVADLQRLRS